MSIGGGMLTNKKIGGWCWALSGEEGMTALVVGRALREGADVPPRMRRRYDAMMEKQKKLLARQRSAGVAA